VWEVEPERISGVSVDTPGYLSVAVPGRPGALFSLGGRAEAWRELLSSLYDPDPRDN
jgi:hypothetical protein